MPCFHPLSGYRSRSVSGSGKRPIVFDVKQGYADLPVQLPCGQCRGCRLERARQWAVRCMHEASLYERNCFLTLTCDDEHMLRSGSLDKSAFPKFMKRLRKAFPHERPRYFHAGEYGDRFGRPHYHSLVFNFDFADKTLWAMRNGYPVWRSGLLEELWKDGQSEIGSVTFESASYVARYVMKKVTGDAARDHYVRLDEETGELMRLEPEYTTMSRRPGIGAGWYEEFKGEVFPSDSVVSRGRLMKPPRYYFGKYEVECPKGARKVLRKRERKRRVEDESPERLEVREKVLEAKMNLLKGGR